MLERRGTGRGCGITVVATFPRVTHKAKALAAEGQDVPEDAWKLRGVCVCVCVGVYVCIWVHVFVVYTCGVQLSAFYSMYLFVLLTTSVPLASGRGSWKETTGGFGIKTFAPLPPLR